MCLHVSGLVQSSIERIRVRVGSLVRMVRVRVDSLVRMVRVRVGSLVLVESDTTDKNNKGGGEGEG